MLRFSILSGLILSCIFCVGQKKINIVKFDSSLLNIQYIYSSEYMDFYAATDNKNNGSKKDMPIFAITTHYGTTRNSSIKYIEYQKNRELESGKKILRFANEDSSIDGNNFYSMTINTTDNLTNQKQTVLYGFLLKNDTAIIFLGSDMGKQEYFYKLKKTFYSMRP